MQKKRKRHIDMTARLNIKFVPATEEEKRQLEIELENLNARIEEKNKKYRADLQKRITDSLQKQNCKGVTDDDANYFIEKYGYLIERKRSEETNRRIAYYQSILSKKKEKEKA